MGGLTLPTQTLERLIEIGRRLTANLDLESLLREIAEASRELTGARYAALGVLNEQRDALDRFITVGIDDALRAQIGDLPHGRGVLGVLIDNPVPLRLHRVQDHPASYGFPPHHPPMDSFLGVPIVIGDQAYGNLYLTEKHEGDFDDADELAVCTLAAWASIAIQNARSVREDRLRSAIQASENERKHWARELHDETLQSLGGLNMRLSAALRHNDLEVLRAAARDSIEQLQIDIKNLRAMITELRPSALDEIGLAAAIESLADRVSTSNDLKVDTDLHLPAGLELSDELEVVIYRLVQEAANNAIRHAGASHLWISVDFAGPTVELNVRDDGAGFEPESVTRGFGLLGMRERVSLVGGELEMLAAPGAGTTLRAILPVPASAVRSEPVAEPVADGGSA